jgi:hypothetical protein
MKDLTTTSLGLIIAFLLPGLVALHAMSFWSPGIQKNLEDVWTADTSAGSFLLVTLASLAVGLQVTLLRWIVFERWLCRTHQLSAQANGGD